MADAPPAMGPDIHEPITDTSSLWDGSPTLPDNQTDTLEREAADDTVETPAPKAPEGEYDLRDPTWNDTDTAQTPATDDESGLGEPPPVGITDKSGNLINEDFTPQQYMRAAQLGFTHGELVEIGSPKALEVVLRREEMSRVQRQQAQQTQQRQQQQAPAPNPFLQFADPAKIAAAIAPSIKPTLDKAALVAQGIDESVVNALEQAIISSNQQAVQAIAQQYGPAFQQAAALHDYAVRASAHEVARQQADVARAQQAEQQAITNWNREFKTTVKALPEKWRAVVESGSNEKELHTMCGVLAESLNRLGQPIPDAKALVEMAIRTKFANQADAVVRDQLREEVGRRNQRGIARTRPGGGRAPQTGVEAAIKFATTYGKQLFG